MLLDRKRVKFWQKWVFAIMAVLMAGSLVVFSVGSGDCGGSTTSATSEYDADIATYKAAVKADPKDADSWRLLAETYELRANQRTDTAAQAVDWRRAAAAYERADKVLAKQKGKAAEKAQVKVLEELANVYLFLEDYELATSAYEQLTALRPRNAQYFFDLATIAINAGDTNTALLAFNRFLELDPKSPDASAVKDWVKANTPDSTTASPSPTEGTGQ